MQWYGNNPYAARQQPVSRVAMRMKRAPAENNIVEGGYLMHSGIRGMKWGIRRYQNEDGSYTEEGKIRYGRVSKKEEKKETKKESSEKAKALKPSNNRSEISGSSRDEGRQRPESETWKKSDAEHLSDEELNRRNLRLQREKQYRDLTTSEVERESSNFRKDLIKKALLIPVAALVGILGKKYITNHSEKIGKVIGKYANRAISKIGTVKNKLLNKNTSQLKNLGENYSHAKGSPLNYRPGGKYSHSFLYRNALTPNGKRGQIGKGDWADLFNPRSLVRVSRKS